MSFLRGKNKELFTAPESTTTEQQAVKTPNRIRQMRLAALAIAPILGIGAIAGSAHEAKDRVATVAESDKTHAAAEWQHKMSKAAEARRAIAERYADCVVTNVTDTHTSTVRPEQFPDGSGLPYSPERVTRNEVIITVKATKNPAAMAAEQAYANGTPDAGLVQWDPFTLGASTSVAPKEKGTNKYSPVQIPRRATSEETAPGEETFIIKMYPRTDRRRTTTANVSLVTHLETYDHNNGDDVTYVDEGIMNCGSLREVLVEGRETWQAIPDATGTPKFELNQVVCANVPTEMLGIYTEQCS
jgi:hypothetical protein